MSVYSGFATRLNEQQYNKQIVNLIKVLQRRVIKFYRSEPADEDAFKLVFQQVLDWIHLRSTPNLLVWRIVNTMNPTMGHFWRSYAIFYPQTKKKEFSPLNQNPTIKVRVTANVIIINQWYKLTIHKPL